MGGLPGPTEYSQDKEQVHSQFPASTAPPSKSAAHQAKLPSRAGMRIFVLTELHRNNTIAFYFPVREFFLKLVQDKDCTVHSKAEQKMQLTLKESRSL